MALLKKEVQENGYQVYVLNPLISTCEDATCYANLKSIPEKVVAAFILANPKVT